MYQFRMLFILWREAWNSIYFNKSVLWYLLMELTDLGMTLFLKLAYEMCWRLPKKVSLPSSLTWNVAVFHTETKIDEFQYWHYYLCSFPFIIEPVLQSKIVISCREKKICNSDFYSSPEIGSFSLTVIVKLNLVH